MRRKNFRHSFDVLFEKIDVYSNMFDTIRGFRSI